LARHATFTGHTAPVFSVSFSADGSRLVSASQDRTVRLWDTETGRSLAVLEGHTDEVFSAVFHPDGRRITSAGRDRAILIWDVSSGAEVARLHGHTNYVYSLAFSPDGSTLASASGDFTVRLWDTAPAVQRLKARHEAEAIRPQAEALVERLFRQEKTPAQEAHAVRSDRTLSNVLRREVQRAIWRRVSGDGNGNRRKANGGA
jgi:WD40 repeat protein